MKYYPMKTTILALLVALSALIADIITQNPSFGSYGAVIGAIIGSLIEFEKEQPS